MANKFVHLHVHSEYSLLDGLSKIQKLIAKCKELEMPAVALTDHGVMYGAIDFYKECQKQNIKPLVGMEAYTTVKDHKVKEGKQDNNHLLLIAKNYTGYKNLMKLSTIAQVEGFYYKPRFSRELLKEYSQGLICTSACPKGEVGQALIDGNYQNAKDIASWFAKVFKDDYYLEIQRHNYQDFFDSAESNPKILDGLKKTHKAFEVWESGIIKISRELGIPLVATNDAHYINKSDATAQDALVCISTGKNMSDTQRLRYIDAPTYYITTSEEMINLFPDFPDALENTVKIADKCDLQLNLGKSIFPIVSVPGQTDLNTYLREEVHKRTPRVYDQTSDELANRINLELDTIINKGLAQYFLMIMDLTDWCTTQKIIFNTRGSAAGSVVSYILGITTIDPIKYLLPFERFLNPYRPSSPDIDLDIADDRREELVNYIIKKYGQDKVAQVCTFGRMLARAAVRDIARVLGHPYAMGDKIAKVIPMGSQGFPMTIERALNESLELKAMYDNEPEVKQVIELAREIEGNARHISVHAAAVVVAPEIITEYTPLQLEPKGTKIITQYEMHALIDEYGGVGLVKIDVLGIRNLSILGKARDIVEKLHNIKVDLGRIPLDDKKTFAMLARGETMGTFQLGGSGMTKWLKELKPNRVEDLMIMVAIFRPGPMANIPEFIARKNKRSPVTYMFPQMEKYLDKSYGILVYQDDVLFTALEMAGYTWETVDKFRKAIGKKLPKEMAEQHEIFVEGCQKTSRMTKEQAEKLWDLFVPFQGYGFNKAHAASYGIVAYQTAYMKANYPVEYMTALFTAESGDTEKIVEAVEECRRMKITVLGPDINKSDTNFTIDNGAIRFGLSAIKNAGAVAITLILEARKLGPFTSLTDFCLRVDSQKVNRKVLESLIKSGAMDQFGNRAAMLAALDKIRERGTSISKLKNLGQSSLFGEEETSDSNDHLPNISEFEKRQKLEMEKELLGFYLTEHPKAEKLVQLGEHITHRISELQDDSVMGQRVTVGGIIEVCRNVVTKANNQPMCFIKISDMGKSVEVVVFPKVYAIDPSIWQVDKLVLVTGRTESRTKENNEEDIHDVTLIADSATEFTGSEPKITPQSSTSNNQTITIPKGFPSGKLVTLNNLLQNHKGSTPIHLEFLQNGTSKILPLPYGLKWDSELANQIALLLK